jgi:hypothetical protein
MPRMVISNACGEPRPKAGATEERTLLGVGSSAWFGTGIGTDTGVHSDFPKQKASQDASASVGL